MLPSYYSQYQKPKMTYRSIATTLDICSHTVLGLQKAAAERLDALLPKVEQQENVGRRG